MTLDIFAIIIILVLGTGIALGVFIKGKMIENAMKFVLNPSDEAKYELHPTINPQTVEITDKNVRDIIDVSIEDGVDHPALAARKGH